MLSCYMFYNELSIDSKDKTFYIVRTSSNGEEQAYAVPYEKPDIIGNYNPIDTASRYDTQTAVFSMETQ